ncbi:MAG: PKD domain-containing protein, partial [Saprospiraceae bacterium]|nr:PKD domain-containing protein [Saprospiraceae bacterium]
NRLFYTVEKNNQQLVQYDLEAINVNSSRTLLATWDGYIDSIGVPAAFSYMQPGPDGKLYIWGGSKYMHLVDFPDRQGLACHARQRAIKLPGYTFAAGLYYPHYRLGPIDGSSCDTLGLDNHPTALFRYDLEDTLAPLQVTFTDVSSYLPTAWHWDFGDGQMSQDTNPVHTYSQPGVYQVCLMASNTYAADTFCRQVVVGTSGLHELPALPQARVVPNPFSGEIRVQLPALVGVAPQFVLSDLYGRPVLRASLRDFETTLSLPGLPAGIYVWQLFWNGVQTQQGKVVKVE